MRYRTGVAHTGRPEADVVDESIKITVGVPPHRLQIVRAHPVTLVFQPHDLAAELLADSPEPLRGRVVVQVELGGEVLIARPSIEEAILDSCVASEKFAMFSQNLVLGGSDLDDVAAAATVSRCCRGCRGRRRPPTEARDLVKLGVDQFCSSGQGNEQQQQQTCRPHL